MHAVTPTDHPTTSPVPRLTSLYHRSEPGNYGDRRYPGNCSGTFIRDLLHFFRPVDVFDPMTGSGICRDVCRELGIQCVSGDIHAGFDLCDAAQFSGASPRIRPGSFEFVWIHPPYWRQKLYAADARDLSRAPTLWAFLERYALAIRNCVTALRPGGKIAILMGDYTDRETGYVPLVYHTKHLASEVGLMQCCTDIIRFSHGNSSSRKVYCSSFIPGLHDVCCVFEKPR